MVILNTKNNPEKFKFQVESASLLRSLLFYPYVSSENILTLQNPDAGPNDTFKSLSNY